MKKGMVILLCAGIAAAAWAGGSQEKSGQQPAAGSTAAPAQSGAQVSAGPEALILPIAKEPLKLTVFAGLADRAAVSMKNYNEMLAFQEMEKRTGIKIDFRHPPVGSEQVKVQFNLMLAANDLTDMIYYTWATDFVGGPERAINDGIIVPLNDLIDKYAPNFKKILEENPNVRKDAVTDSGKIYMFPLLRLTPTDLVSGGFQIRKDWLDKLNLKMPTTIDEWYTVLKAFKERDPNGNGKADEIPFISSKIVGITGVERFSCAWGFPTEYYRDGSLVKYGPMQPEYKDFLATMRKWYKEGLIDPDFLTSDRKNHDAKVTSEVAGAYYGLLNSYMGTYTKTMPAKNPKFEIREAPIPKAPDGKMYNFHTDAARAVATEGFAVSTANKHLKETVKWLDYYYSEPGRVLMNLGVEGVTFKMVNGEAVYTDLITNNPKGLSLDRAICAYTPAGASCRLFQDTRYWKQMMTYDNQKEAMKILGEASLERVLPPITPTPEESTRFAAIQNEVNTYVGEMFAKFVMGQESLDNYDKYVRTLKSLNIDEALGIQQAAFDRYLKRK